MNRIPIWVVAGLAAWVPLSASCAVIMEGAWSRDPAPYVYMSITPGINGFTGKPGVNLVSPKCGITAIVYEPTIPNVGRRTAHRYHLDGFQAGSGNSGTCFGIPVEERMSMTEWTTALSVRIQRMPVPYHDSFTANNDLSYQCYGGVYRPISGGPYTVHTRSHPFVCTGAPPTAACSVTTPESIVHAGANTGWISSEKRTAVTVTCTDNATVKVSVPPAVRLNNGAQDMNSRMYVERVGVTEVTTTASPAAVVDLISVIQTEQSQAGTYSGSGVITVEWP